VGVSLSTRLRSAFSLAERATPDTTVRGSDSATYVSGGTRTLAEQETAWQLRGTQGNKTYRSMRLDDPHIRGLRRAQNLPMMQASADVDPADPDDADAVAKADFVREVLIDDYPFRSFVADSMLALDYGFAAFEIVWFRDGTGRIRCRLELRPSSSIPVDKIAVRDGAIEKVTQTPLDGGERDIPGDKLVWFCHEAEGVSFQGTPILRSMYRPWKIKRELEQELPSAVRRLAGIPDISYAGTIPDDVKTALEQVGERIGLSADGYALHPDAVTVQLLTGNVDVGDILEAIKAQDAALSAVCQAQVFDLGTSNAGSRALGTTLSDLFANGVQAEAKYREDVINQTGGVIHQLIGWNFPTDDNRPRLRFGHVQAVDMRAFAQGLASLAPVFASMPPEVQDWARSELNMPEGPPVTQVVVPTSVEPSASASSKSQGPGADAADGSAPEGTHAAECCAGGLQLAEGRTLRREPLGVECFVQLAEVDARFADAKTAVRVATQATRDKLTAEMVRRAADAQAAGKLDKFSAGAPPMVDALTAEVRAVLDEFYAAGRAQVEDELDRQRRGEPVTEGVIEARREGIAAAEKPKPKKPQLPDPDVALSVQAEAVARGIADSTMVAAAAAAARVAAGTPLTPSAFTEAVTRASDDAALRLGLTVSDAMILGRSVVAGERAYQIEQAVYSAILDDRTCSACEPMDGETTTDMDEAAGWCPNPECEGGLHCRCIQVYELNPDYTEAAA